MAEDIEKRVARLFIAGFEGTAPDRELRELIKLGLGGVILFSRNLPDLTTALALNRRLAKESGSFSRPLILCLDQEGGKVQRLGPPVIQLPPMRQLGRSNDPELCYLAGAQLGRELSAAGFMLNLAPVLDVDTNPRNPIIGDRAFSSVSDDVARLGVSFARGLQAGGVGACAKHFPGHGDTDSDSHRQLPDLPHDLDRLRGTELEPFRQAASAGVAAMMVAHLRVLALDAERASSLSPTTYELARQELGYDGLLLTDDMEMGAVAENPGVVAAAVAAVEAGADGVLVCHRPRLVAQAIQETVRKVEKGELSVSRIEQSNRRWDELARRFSLGARRPDQARLSALIHSFERAELEKRLGDLLEQAV